MTRCLLIAEAGVNHNGSLELALRLVDAAADAGADAVKFQTFRAERTASAHAAKAAYQRHAAGPEESQVEMLRRLELSEEAHLSLLAHCRRRGIRFLSTPFDPESADLLARIGVDLLKLPSGELTNHPLLAHVASKGLPVILSTGMATLAEVGLALEVLQGAGAAGVTLLHCVTEYPAPPAEINLRAMATLRGAFQVPVGYSDHSEGDAVALAAVALGASVLEKHFTLDRALPGPDHRASLEPGELRALVQRVRLVESALGDGIKRPAPCELPNRLLVRRSLVATRPLGPGTRLAASDLTAKRPGTGIPPSDLPKVLGMVLARPLEADGLLTWEALQP